MYKLQTGIHNDIKLEEFFLLAAIESAVGNSGSIRSETPPMLHTATLA